MEKRSDFALVPKGLLGKVKKKIEYRRSRLNDGKREGWRHDSLTRVEDSLSSTLVWLISTASGWEKPQTVTQKLPTKLDGSWTD